MVRVRSWARAAAYRVAVIFAADNAELHFRLGNVQTRRGYWPAAIAAYEAAIARDGSNAEWHFRLGNARAKVGDYVGAAEAYAAAITKDDGNTLWHEGLARARARLGDWSGAAAAYEDAIARDDTHAEWYFRFGGACARIKDWKGAAEAYGAAVARDGRNSYWHFRLAFARTRLGDWNGAAAAYEAAAALEPDNADFSLRAGEVRKRLEDWEPATRAYHAAFDLSPADDRCRYNLAGCLAQSGQDAEASRLLAPLEAKGDALLSRFLQDCNGSVKSTTLFVPGRRTIFARRIVESNSTAERVFFEQMKPEDAISQRVTIFYESLRRESARPDFVPGLHYQATMNDCRYFLFDHIDVSSTLALELLRNRHGIDRELGRSAVECLVRISSGFEDLFQRANIAHRAFHKIYSARVEPYLERQFRINGADAEYAALLERTLAAWPSHEARFQKVPLVPCHGDSHAENFIVSREGAVSVIDWEHYGWAPMGADLVWVFADRLGCPEFEVCLDQYFDGVAPATSADERRYLIAILAIFAAMNKGQHLSIKWLRYLNA